MTFIVAVRTVNGILVAADSLEMETGAISRWDDFDLLLKSKHLSEDDSTLSLSPAEVKAIFKGERIKNRKGVQKIFPIADNSLLLVAGDTVINQKHVHDIADDIKAQIKNTSNPTASDINTIVFNSLNAAFNEDNRLTQKAKESCEFILCIRENQTNFIFRLKYRPKHDYTEKQFSSVGNDCVQYIVNMAGTKGAANISGKTFLTHIPTPVQAFRIAKNLMNLAILSEEVSQDLPGVGGDVFYMYLYDDGWKFILNETDVLNCIKYT